LKEDEDCKCLVKLPDSPSLQLTDFLQNIRWKLIGLLGFDGKLK